MTNRSSSTISSVERLSIGDVAERAGIRTSALRYYESIGLLPEPERVNGRRVYDESILQRLTILQMAQKAGFTMKEIDELFHGFDKETPPAARWQSMAHKKLEELDATIDRAQKMKSLLKYGLNCKCLHLDECVIVMESSGVSGAERGSIQ